MTNSLLIIDSADLTKLDQKEIVSLAEQASRDMLLKINEAAIRIENSKDEAEKAKNMKAGWFGKTTKKADATADALVRANEAIAEMHALIQESVRYTQLNRQLSKAMHSALSKMIFEGFKNQDGELTHLNKSGDEMAQIILEEAENFSEKQLEIETLQARQAEEIRNVAVGGERLAEKIGQDIERLKRENEDHAHHLKSIIVEKSDAILNRSDANDKMHQKLIDGLQASTKDIRQSSDEQDRIHSEQILDLQKRVADQEALLEASRQAQAQLAHKSLTYMATALSIFAIGLSGFLLYQV